MSLKKCPECHKKVSNQATHCVKCGYPFRKNKVVHMHIPELEDMRAILKGINKNLEEMKHSDIDENSISISFFKIGIIAPLFILFLIPLVAAITSTLDAFTEFSILFIVIAITFVVSLISMAVLMFLANLERKKSKKRFIKHLSAICAIIICVYIAISVSLYIIYDIFIHDEKMKTCFMIHAFFGGGGLAISSMIQEVWHTKDKPFIFAFISLVCAFIVGIIT